MPNELVRKRSAHSLQQQRVVRVLENAAVSLLLDILEIVSRVAVSRILLAHITKAPGELSESLAVGAFAKPLHGKMTRLGERWTRENCDSWFEKYHFSVVARRGASGR